MDFTTVYNRKNTRSLKWDEAEQIFQAEDILPMWVADMDFKAPKEVNQALIKRAEHGIYGYTVIDERLCTVIQHWIKQQHQWNIESDWLIFHQGVIPALQTAIQALTNINDKILIQTPVYTPFYDVIKNLQRKIVKNPLIYQKGHYTIDFEHLEQQFKTGIKAFIFCSPHNPVGRVWTREELLRIIQLCKTYDVMILSDEIHCDLIYLNYKHIPIASLSEEAAKRTVTFMAPSKTFNLAGLQASYSIASEKSIKQKLNIQKRKNGMTFLNTMGITALEAAYMYGAPWLKRLMETLESNKSYVINTFAAHIPEIKVIPPEGTYLLWLDCKNLGMSHQQLRTFMIEEAKVGLNDGIQYGKSGAQFMRMNIACPEETLKKGVQRIINAVKQRFI